MATQVDEGGDGNGELVARDVGTVVVSVEVEAAEERLVRGGAREIDPTVPRPGVVEEAVALAHKGWALYSGAFPSATD
jgi:hypothetical protein